MKNTALSLTLILAALIGGFPGGLALAQTDTGIKDAKGKTLFVAVDAAAGEGFAERLGAALQSRIADDEGAKDTEVRAFSTSGPDYTAETMLGIPTDARRDIGALVELRFAPAAEGRPAAVAEVYHYAFGAIAKEHVRSPEYSFKFASDSALLAIELHRVASGTVSALTYVAASGAPHLPGFEIAPASAVNPLLPEQVLRKSVILTVAAPDGKPSPDQVDALARLLADAFLIFRREEGSFAMGVVPDSARKRGAPQNLKIEIQPFVYNTSTEGAKAADKDAQAAKDSSAGKAQTVVPFPSGLYYAARLSLLSPYAYTIADPAASELRRKAGEGGFVTASVKGIVRTVPVRLDGYKPLEHRAAEEAEPIVEAKTFDTVIEGATVFDGAKDSERFVADVGIVGERIAAVGDLKGKERKETVAGKGLFLMPGIIDIHSHAEEDLLKVAYAPTHVRQGITTVLGGNCADSPLGIGEYLGKAEAKGVGLNVGVLEGNTPVRRRVLGKRTGMFPYDDLYREKELVDLAMEEGAFGMSTGLIYSTSEEAFAWELAEMAKQMKPYGGFYASHVRGETDEVLDAIREAIHIGELAEVPVQISHMKVLSKRNWGQMADYIEIMKEARARGLDVMGDQYPWRASGPAGHYNLHKLMVREAIQNESPEVVLLKDMPGKYEKYSGRPLDELLAAEKMTPEDLIQDLNLTADSKLYATYLCIGAEDILLPMKEDFVMVCTDSGLVSLEYIEQGKAWDEHPRKFRSYPEFFAKYVRDKKVCSWELAVYKCTGLPASRMKLTDRGAIKPGAYADLVLLDPSGIDPGGDYRDQTAPPKGMPYVFINGQAVVKSGELTKTQAGKPLYAYGHRKP